MKEKIYNIFFQPTVRKSCHCGSNSKRGAPKHTVFACGEYINAKWHTVDYFCQQCFQTRIVPRLLQHMGEWCCKIAIRARSGYSLPDWITL